MLESFTATQSSVLASIILVIHGGGQEIRFTDKSAATLRGILKKGEAPLRLYTPRETVYYLRQGPYTLGRQPQYRPLSPEAFFGTSHTKAFRGPGTFHPKSSFCLGVI